MEKASFLDRLYGLLISLKFAVGVILALLVSLIVATVLESLYDTPTAQYWVYKSPWFIGILAMLGVNILTVALSRLPWKRHHLPFLLAHLGILLLLVGSWVTQRHGLDGQLRLQEGEAASIVELGENVLVLSEGSEVRTVPMEWIPPMVTFKPFRVEGLPLEVVEYISHAEPQVRFVESEDLSRVEPAIQLKVEGGPMRISQEFWLWSGDPNWAVVQAGPAQLRMVTPKYPRVSSSNADESKARKGPVFQIALSTDRKSLDWEAIASDGKSRKQGRVLLSSLPSAPIETGWKGGVTISVGRYIARGQAETTYSASRMLYGQQAPPSAIRLRATEGGGSSVWLGLGDRAMLQLAGREVALGYSPAKVRLPFSLRLEQFSIERYDGTMSPREYSSRVSVPGEGQSLQNVTISMNEPLIHRGVTFYQASYEDAQPRPTVSIFSVNRDPGRGLKYGGSLLIVLGTILLFARNYMRKRASMKKANTPALATATLLALSVLGLSSPAQAVERRSGWSFKELGLTPVHSGGRLKPLDSYAREAVLLVTGSRSFQGWDPVELVLSWLAYPTDWDKVDFVSVGLGEARRQLGLDESRSRFTPAELLQDSYLVQYAYRIQSGKGQVPNLSGGVVREDPREQELKRILSRLQAFRGFGTGESWLIVPMAAPAAWLTLAGQEPEGKQIRDRVMSLVESYRKGDRDAFDRDSTALRETVSTRLRDVSPSDARAASVLGFESIYNRTHPFLWGWILFLAASIFWSTAIVTGATESQGRKGWVNLSRLATALGTMALVFGISLRCYIAGRPPVSNMYESIIWVAFGVMLFAFVIHAIQRQAVVLAVATGLSCFALIAADSAPAMMDPGIHPLVPVLRSNYWLTIHVLTITLGYAAFALSLGLGNVTLWQFYRRATQADAGAGSASRIATLNQLCYRAMQFGVVLLAAGIILGGIWADYSWGRFWGWDPKEVWALIALLGYIAILHARYVAWVDQFAFAAWSVVSFLLVVMAWYGVNFVLGVGLHSYGFSSGGRGWVALFSSLQLLYVGVIAWIHRRRQHSDNVGHGASQGA